MPDSDLTPTRNLTRTSQVPELATGEGSSPPPARITLHRGVKLRQSVPEQAGASTACQADVLVCDVASPSGRLRRVEVWETVAMFVPEVTSTTTR